MLTRKTKDADFRALLEHRSGAHFQSHITSAIFNTSSSNLHQCVQNDQPIVFNEVHVKYFNIKQFLT